MPHTEIKTVYYFNELDDDAKERAREWFREWAFDYEWWEFTYDYCKEFLTAIGFDFAPKAAEIYFSGFCSQGDGACFNNVSWSAGDVKPDEALKEFVSTAQPSSKEATRKSALIKAASFLAARYPKLNGYIEHAGRYYHPHATSISTSYDEDGDYEEEFAEFARNCMNWVYRCLEDEHDYLNSDESVDELIQINEYKFDEDGKQCVC